MENSNRNLARSIAVIAFAFVLAGVIFITCCFSAGSNVAHAAIDYKSVGKAAYLIDSATGSVIYARNEKERLPIASMVKIMTALLTLEAVDNGEITLDDDVTVSEESAGMGGSQVFLDAGSTHKVRELLKSVIVASANDSCVALAEHISGSTSAFVAKMNARAKELGMNDSSFKNCTGLPQAESFSCAKDVAAMFSQLIKHPTYFEFAKIWMEDYQHPSGRVTSITNTNKLVRFYNGCDGGKTGFTSEAKFCLAATAKRNDTRIIAVMIGADSSKNRNAAISAMFDHAFANYQNKIIVKAGDNIENGIEVLGGKKSTLNVTVREDIAQFMSNNDTSSYEIKYELATSVKAPVKAGDTVGKIYLVKDGVVQKEYDAIANETVERMSLYDAIKELAKKWNIAA